MSAWSEYMSRLVGDDSAKTVATKIGVDPSQVSRWKTGKSEPSAENASRLAQAYNGDRLEALEAAGHFTPASGLDPAIAFPELPDLPRNAPNAPVLGQVDIALGVHPNRPSDFLPMSATERQLLVSARNKLVHFGAVGADFTDEETEALTRFIEDDELRTLHVRIDWLPRAEQLEVSALVNQLQMALEERWVADGYNNESESLPDYAQPNPLPVLGVAPDPRDFPSRVPTFKRKEEHVQSSAAPAKSHASAEAVEDQEAPPLTSSDVDLAARKVNEEPKADPEGSD